jgi:acyl carrier protein
VADQLEERPAALRGRTLELIREMAGVSVRSVDDGAVLTADLGYDSLGLIELAGALEAEFALRPVSERDLAGIETAADVVELVAALCGRAEAGAVERG